ncbi:Uncharacterized protein TCM_043398 [Theobroma cacao]|uniref:Uncharacterized protein n=1 Tax=Theobroma cacao TaxID=3641 RepID=A0A061FQD8_THECC|nr:Uncharacterized protein TCM_043398 [Theobroma cacao]
MGKKLRKGKSRKSENGSKTPTFCTWEQIPFVFQDKKFVSLCETGIQVHVIRGAIPRLCTRVLLGLW